MGFVGYAFVGLDEVIEKETLYKPRLLEYLLVTPPTFDV